MAGEVGDRAGNVGDRFRGVARGDLQLLGELAVLEEEIGDVDEDGAELGGKGVEAPGEGGDLVLAGDGQGGREVAVGACQIFQGGCRAQEWPGEPSDEEPAPECREGYREEREQHQHHDVPVLAGGEIPLERRGPFGDRLRQRIEEGKEVTAEGVEIDHDRVPFLFAAGVAAYHPCSRCPEIQELPRDARELRKARGIGFQFPEPVEIGHRGVVGGLPFLVRGYGRLGEACVGEELPQVGNLKRKVRNGAAPCFHGIQLAEHGPLASCGTQVDGQKGEVESYYKHHGEKELRADAEHGPS